MQERNNERNRIEMLIEELNEASMLYYNSEKTKMSDQEFDQKLEELQSLEKKTGIILSNSPTISVGAKVLTELVEVKHNHPMLSLDKCHKANEILKWSKGNNNLIAMIKADGLTISIKYENGKLVSSETRGNGITGSDCTEHIKQFLNVPLHINKEGIYVIDGEAIIYKKDFESINKDKKFKNPRNTASGSLAVLDTKLVKDRRLSFVAWDVIEGGSYNSLHENLLEARKLGFTTIPRHKYDAYDEGIINKLNDRLMTEAELLEGIPCDGVVWKFDDIKYAKSLGRTEHHFNGGIAWKPEKIEKETQLKDIEWTMGKTGVLTPVAVFKPVELDGTTVERASLHNVSLMTELLGSQPYNGQVIKVYKANMIIPQVSWADKDNSPFYDVQYIHFPSSCPLCGGETEIQKENDSENLVCTNAFCKGKILGLLNHFVSKDCMNIDGLSEATLDFLLKRGWIKEFKDLYLLEKNPLIIRTWKGSAGYGVKSVDKILDSIEKSKETTLERLLDAISIPLVGSKASKDIARYVDGSPEKFIETLESNAYLFSNIDGIGDKMIKSLIDWRDCKEFYNQFLDLLNLLEIKVMLQEQTKKSSITQKSFCITGSLEEFKNRKELVVFLESYGAKVTDTVSKNTDFLINNDKNSSSSKNKKAQTLNIPIIMEKELLNMIGE